MYVIFFAVGVGRGDIQPKRKEMKKSRDRGDNNVRFDRKDVRRTHTHTAIVIFCSLRASIPTTTRAIPPFCRPSHLFRDTLVTGAPP